MIFMAKVGFRDKGKKDSCRELALKYFPTTNEKNSEYVTNLLMCLHDGIFIILPAVLIASIVEFFIAVPLIFRLVG